MQRISVQERRARIAIRHRLAPGNRAADVADAAQSLVSLHASDPATVYLSAWARIDGFVRSDLERALYDERSLVKHMAMRRTVWVVPRGLLADVQTGASDRVAGREHGKLVREVEKAGHRSDGAGWLDGALNEINALLADGREATSAEVRDAIPALAGSLMQGAGKASGAEVPISPRVLVVASSQGRIVRATNDGGWNVARHRWAAMDAWLGEPLEPRGVEEAERRLVQAWLKAFGPGTEGDIKWWLGSTLTGVRKALAALEAVEVEIDGGTGYVLPGDLEPTGPVEPWGALLPPLDPTTMGWFAREWYLGPYKPQLFDLTGNSGPVIMWEGRIVGGWRQHASGEVELQLLEEVGADATAVLEAEAARLSDWFAGQRALPRFPSPLSKGTAKT